MWQSSNHNLRRDPVEDSGLAALAYTVHMPRNRTSWERYVMEAAFCHFSCFFNFQNYQICSVLQFPETKFKQQVGPEAAFKQTFASTLIAAQHFA
jgi:hypothetical protein